MVRRVTVALLAVLTIVLSAAAQAPEQVDSAAIAKIREEGLKKSQVMETMFFLTDRYGPRLTGSKEFEEAGDWAVKQLQAWGVANVRKERFTFGRGWSLVKFHATMTWGYVVLLRAAMDRSPGASFDQLLAENATLADHQSGILYSYYDRALLDSEEARRCFVLPRRA